MNKTLSVECRRMILYGFGRGGKKVSVVKWWWRWWCGIADSVVLYYYVRIFLLLHVNIGGVAGVWW